MGYDLMSRKSKSSFYWNGWDWPRVLQLASSHGWSPAGSMMDRFPVELRHGTDVTDEVVAAEAAQWDGSYASNDFQLVTDADASCLADALERGLNADAFTASGSEQSTSDPELQYSRAKIAWAAVLEKLCGHPVGDVEPGLLPARFTLVHSFA